MPYSSGVQIDTTSFNDGILRLLRRGDSGAFLEALEKAAAFLIGHAVEHAPKDTGYLASTGTWNATSPTEVELGFNCEDYGYVQDQGSSKLPCKGYESDIGPNEYFTGTLSRFHKTALKIIAQEIGRQLGTA